MSVQDKDGFVPDSFRFDFARRDVQELIGLLTTEIYLRRPIIEMAEKAGISAGNLNLEQPARWIWSDALKAAGKRGRLRLLLNKMLEDEDYAFAHRHIRKLLAGEPIAVAASAPDAAALKKDWQGGKEAKTAPRSGLVDIGYLAAGLRAAKSVFRIGVMKDAGLSHGTGFLIAPGRVLTNHHVLFDDGGRPGKNVVLHVGHELGPDGREASGEIVHAMDASIRGDKELDWAVVDFETPIAEAAALPLGKERPQMGDYVAIIQHPFGGMKKIALFHNEVRFIDDTRLQYLTDTEAGSSGSPVLNTRWEVVALHHSWVQATEERLQVRNEGMLIGPVAEALRAAGLLPAQA